MRVCKLVSLENLKLHRIMSVLQDNYLFMVRVCLSSYGCTREARDPLSYHLVWLLHFSHALETSHVHPELKQVHANHEWIGKSKPMAHATAIMALSFWEKRVSQTHNRLLYFFLVPAPPLSLHRPLA